ncbi:MAG: sodium:proton antiporter [Coriobacteriia bacterium]|nr:sodium:proton antiporter [Coriobacteriia bacterium]
MEALDMSLYLLIAVLASSVVSQFLPRVSTPLIQIGLGVALAVIAREQISITLDPDLFLVLFIAPLLYDEAREADLAALWHYRKPILGYAIGLVLVITLAVGFFVHWLLPFVPLAAAFALGAALGPTDAVAVASLSKNPTIPERVKSLLKGEALLNDASGLVAFRFAVAAAVYGTFSPAYAAQTFLVKFFGGLLLGALCGLLLTYVITRLREGGLENTTFHVLLEICTPLLVFILAEEVHVSGVICVVICGIIQTAAPRQTGPSYARTNIVSTSVWKVITFALNGVVFILLGTQLPSAMVGTWEGTEIDNTLLVLMVLGITVLLELVRFLWTLALQLITAKADGRPFTREDAKDALILTLSGAKGTITLSIMLTLPLWTDVAAGTLFPQRDLLIFLASGVILCTFTIATFVVPLLAPQPKKTLDEHEQHLRDTEAYLDVLRGVIEELTERQTAKTAAATHEVIRSYNKRIERIKENHGLDDQEDVELQKLIIEWKEAYIFDLMAKDETSAEAGYRLLARLAHRKNLLEHQRLSEARDGILFLRNMVLTTLNRLRRNLPLLTESQVQEEYRQLLIRTTGHAIERLQDQMGDLDEPNEQIADAILVQQRTLRPLMTKLPSISTIAHTSSKADQIEATAYRIEMSMLNEAVDQEKISRAYAKKARENIILMQVDIEDRL